MPDFTIHKYIQLLNTLIEKGYHFQTFHEFLTEPKLKCIVLTDDIIKAAKEKALPGAIMFTIHPQRWHN